MTGNPSRANAFLWDGKGGDDLDVWTVLSRRYYGTWTSPAHTRAGKSRARANLALIDKVRTRGKMVWAYTYTGTPGTPGLAATEPLSNPRMLLLWTALEHVQGVLYAQGMTSYTTANPRESIGTGEKVLVYPGPTGPWPSARLAQIRDGVEDWAIFDLLRQRRGQGAVRAILGSAGLFSADRGRRPARVQPRLRAAVDDEVRLASLVAGRHDAPPDRGCPARGTEALLARAQERGCERS